MVSKQNLNNEAKKLAKTWLQLSEKHKRFSDKIYAKRMDKFFQNSKDKSFVISVIDKAFRPKSSCDTARIIGEIPELKFLGFFETILVNFYNLTRLFLHSITVPVMKQAIYFATSKYVLLGGEKVLEKRIKKNLADKLHTNLNRVGELLLGQDDAKSRIKQYAKDLENVHVNCISIKISTIYSQISSIGFDATVEHLVEAVKPIYQAAKDNKYKCPITGVESYKLVNLDMEEYRDLDITVEVYMRVLEQEEFKDLTAGIALQAYLPDSFNYLQKITTWAKNRVANGGAPARVRVVKGANMDMELFEARERHWPLAPFSRKEETDANYKLMLEYALQPENIAAVRVGVASHNLFDIAYIYLTAKESNILDLLTFEMLSGMSMHVARMLAKKYGLNILIYLPFSSKEEFVSAIGYLVRRLDENTSRDNYLRYINGLSDDVSHLKMLQDKFEESLYIKQTKNFAAHRTQNRQTEEFEIPSDFAKTYHGEADTDFSQFANVEFVKEIRKKWQNISNLQVDGVIAGKNIAPTSDEYKIRDHNLDEEKIVGSYYNASTQDVEDLLNCAVKENSWQKMSDDERLAIIAKVVDNIRKRRGDIMGAMALETGKPFVESDVEVSEAVDFGNYYAYSYLEMRKELGDLVQIHSKKIIAVLSPWNFPFAIPAGGVFAGLISGANVVLKPSNFATLTAFKLAKCFWDAGVPKEALQFLPSIDSKAAIALTKSKLLDMVIFTGSTNTALSIIKGNPEVKISAEAGGKNVTIATRFCDRDMLIKNVLQSAFSNAGQKCSATSILALEKELYEDKKFLNNLADAARSLIVDNAWNLKVRVNALVRKPFADLEYALTKIEKHESWLVKPRALDAKHTLWSPGIRIGTRKGDKSHLTEFFGPALAIMKIDNLQEGIEIANSTGYGLTSALESLNEEEQLIWKNSIKAGNIYINRPSTGAIVERQPFGGMNKSAFGLGIKAGGLNYLYQFFNFKNKSLPNIDNEASSKNYNLRDILSDLKIKKELQILAIFSNFLKVWENYFSKELDYQNILGQSNVTRFLRLENIAIRADEDAKISDIILVILAAKICVEDITLNIDVESNLVEEINKISPAILWKVNILRNSADDFIDEIELFKRVRVVGSKSGKILKEGAAFTGINVACDEVCVSGRVELLNYLQEQAISNNYHRFGYIAD